MYHLQKYRTKASRHECPSCHDPHSFTYYVDDNAPPRSTSPTGSSDSCGTGARNYRLALTSVLRNNDCDVF